VHTATPTPPTPRPPADPDEAEIKSGANLNGTKCTCGARYCGPSARGTLTFAAGGPLRDLVTINGALPANPYDALNRSTSLQCGDVSCEFRAGRNLQRRLHCTPPPTPTPIPTPTSSQPTLNPPPTQPGEPPVYASRNHTLYLLAEDDLPTYRGWTSSCAPPLYDQSAPPGPCAPVTVVPCTNTPPAVETKNHQEPPFAAWDVTATGAAAPPPPVRAPLRAHVVVSDPLPVSFSSATLTAVGAPAERALVFDFAVSRPALVRYYLVRNVAEVLGRGIYPVFDATANHTVVVSRDCSGVQLAPGTAYGVWYNATDIYGATSPLRMLGALL
jgi:hypothetical protein